MRGKDVAIGVIGFILGVLTLGVVSMVIYERKPTIYEPPIAEEPAEFIGS
jgi:hypothetical protein